MKIYVAYHKPEPTITYLKDHPDYIPIWCGKALKTYPEGTEFLPTLGDDTGDNISLENEHYCELTAQYWAWKNTKDDPDELIGLCHYRRFFQDPEGDNQLLTEKSARALLEDADMIVNGSDTKDPEECIFAESVFKGYCDCHIPIDLVNALIGIYDILPRDTAKEMEKSVLNRSGIACCNMFVARRKIFDEYSKFLFDILKYVDSKIDYKDGIHSGYNARALGFLSERLFRAWSIATNHKTVSVDPIDWEKCSGYKW